MGWSSINMRVDIKNWFKSQWSYEDSDYEVVDSALVQRQTLYGAIRQKSTNEIFCAVFLVRWGRGYYNFRYKDMTEFAGPYEVDCPEKIFKLLTPLDNSNDPNGWAREWRYKVTYLLAKRKQLKGNVIFETKNVTAFTNGKTFKQFKKEGRRIYAGEMVNGKFESHCSVRFNPLKQEFKII